MGVGRMGFSRAWDPPEGHTIRAELSGNARNASAAENELRGLDSPPAGAEYPRTNEHAEGTGRSTATPAPCRAQYKNTPGGVTGSGSARRANGTALWGSQTTWGESKSASGKVLGACTNFFFFFFFCVPCHKAPAPKVVFSASVGREAPSGW